MSEPHLPLSRVCPLCALFYLGAETSAKDDLNVTELFSLGVNQVVSSQRYILHMIEQLSSLLRQVRRHTESHGAGCCGFGGQPASPAFWLPHRPSVCPHTPPCLPRFQRQTGKWNFQLRRRLRTKREALQERLATARDDNPALATVIFFFLV